MCAPSPPPAPDYVGAAQQQGQSNLEATRAGAKLNNPNVISPYGTQTIQYGAGFDQAGYNAAMQRYNRDLAAWNAQAGSGTRGALGTAFFPRPIAPDKKTFQRGDQDVPTITQTFSPEQQAIYDQQVKVKQILGGLGEQGATSLQGIVGKPLDFSGVPAMPGDAEATRQKVIDSMMARVNEDTEVAKSKANSDLIAAGIRPGTKAYDNQMRMIDRSYNDARNQAFLASGQEAQRDYAMDAETRRQAITELLSQRQIPLNEITALMSGSQVHNPFAMPGYGGVQTPGAAPVFAAQNALSGYNTDIFNAGAAGAGNLQTGLFGLGSTALMGAGLYGLGAAGAGAGTAAATGIAGLGMA